MKILPKKTEIVVLKSLERQKEIEEGAKLAQTVDTLRQTKLKEEGNLQKFRVESLKTIQKEIDSKLSEKVLLDGQVQSLQSQLNAIDTLIAVRNMEYSEELADLNEIRDKLDERQRIIIENEKDIQKNQEALKVNAEILDFNKKETAKILTEVNALRDEARLQLSQIHQDRNLFENSCRLKEADLLRKEHDLAFAQIDFNNKLAKLKLNEEALMKEKIRLLDRQQTLERAFKRIKK